jgi:flagellar protein FlaG
MLLQNLNGINSTVAPPAVARTASPVKTVEARAVGTRPLVDPRATAVFAPEKDAPDEASVKVAVEQGNQAMAALSASLSFEVDSSTNTTVVKVIDTTDNSVIRQIPSQEMLDIARALDRVQGLLLRDNA